MLESELKIGTLFRDQNGRGGPVYFYIYIEKNELNKHVFYCLKRKTIFKTSWHIIREWFEKII